MKNIIDIEKSGYTPNSVIESIQFYSYMNPTHSHSNAQILQRDRLNHEEHFGLSIRNNLDGNKYLHIETVEHATKLIEALQIAIDRGWLFTHSELEKYNTSCTDTLRGIIKKRQGLEEE